MKKYAFLILVISGAFFAASKVLCAQENAAFQKANFLVEHKQFFKARAFYQGHQNSFSPRGRLITEARLDLVFNKPEASNHKIEVLFSKYANRLPDSVKYKLTDIKKQNAIRLFEYAKAADAIRTILNRYASYPDSAEIKDYKNSLILWQSLAGQPKQTLLKDGKTVLQTTHDKANLLNILVSLGAVKTHFVFDTGANISTVTQSTARNFGMKIMQGNPIKVGSITGTKVLAQVAICPVLRMGNMDIKNAAFLVVPDSALSFPQIDYKIHGIIGFPIIEAMKEVQITKDGRMIIPENDTTSPDKNLALDLFQLVLNINGNPYVFDSGAQHTFLYKAYYREHQDYIENNFKAEPMKFGGAGGTITVEGFRVPFGFTSSGKTVTIDSVRVFEKNPTASWDDYYGNIGQDVIGKFDKMIINFQSMFLKFE